MLDFPGRLMLHSRREEVVVLVSDHLRQADGVAGSPADQAQVLVSIERLLRGLRGQQEPAVEQQAILEAAYSVMRVQALAWVPHNPGAAVVVRGDGAGSVLEYRQLADLLSVDPEVRPG